MYPERVTLYEVGPRDGLQNESAQLSVDDKVRLIDKLAEAGLHRIEIGTFVGPTGFRNWPTPTRSPAGSSPDRATPRWCRIGPALIAPSPPACARSRSSC